MCSKHDSLHHIKRRNKKMTETVFMTAQEVADCLGTSKAFAYKVIQKLNREMEKEGYLTISGKINRVYFNERLYGGNMVHGSLQG